MPDPTITATTVTLTAAASPVLVVAGVSLGLRADDVIAGLVGAGAALLFFDAVPSTGDTWRQAVRTAAHRAGFALLSAGVAGYGAPVASAVAGGVLSAGMPAERLAGIEQQLHLLCAAVIGGGAQRLFRALIDRAASRVEGKSTTGGNA